MVREAMFNVMLGSMSRKRQERVHVGGGSFAGGQEVLRGGEGGGAGQALAYRPKEGDPSTCILWCTIALGALVQGCPLEFVSFCLLYTKPKSHRGIFSERLMCLHDVYAQWFEEVKLIIVPVPAFLVGVCFFVPPIYYPRPYFLSRSYS